VLYSNADNKNSSGSDKPDKKNPLILLQKAVSRFTSNYARFIAHFRGLSRRAKIFLMTQFSILLLILGMLGRSIYVKHYIPSSASSSPPIEIPYSTFLDFSEGKHKDIKITNLLIGPERIAFKLLKVDTEEQRRALEGKLSENVQVEIPQRSAYTRKIAASPELLSHLRNHNMPFSAAPIKPNYAAMSLRTMALAFYALLLLRMYRTMSGGGGGSNTPGKLATSQNVESASFHDIEGMDSAKFEVMELVDTLRNPDKYAILGARAPTGLLLEGPPGTGKTMLARATAATAGVPLLYCSGSDFVEMFVGRGAARVRNTFEKAAKLAPCIIFIDELDALGKARDSGMGIMPSRGNDEAEQTLNQLLACMDGLDSSKRVCVMAATNRKEVLDPALVRPGRFDRIIKLELPDTAGREKILRVHASKLPGFKEGSGIDDSRSGSLGKGRAVDLSAVASATPGLSGAELEFIVNEAAIRAVRRVSAELQQGMDPAKIVPTVEAIDFEESVKNFFQTRRTKGGVSDLLRSLQK
jgi:ATP-dependent Zn protease